MVNEKLLNQFLLEMAGAQQDRVRNLVAWLTKAETKLLDSLNLDNLTVQQYAVLAKSVAELQKVAFDLMEMMRKVATSKVSYSSDDIEIEELAHMLASCDKDELSEAKKWLSEELPRLRRLKLVAGGAGAKETE